MLLLRAALAASFFAAAAGFGVAGAGAQAPVVPALPDAFMSDNVEYLGSLKQDVGLTTGAKVLEDKLYVTSGKNLSIYDIKDPAKPAQLGTLKLNVAWENEEVPTNGEVLGFASDFYSAGVPECATDGAVTGCMQFFDVRNPANIKQVAVIPDASHTLECALDCQYFFGSNGSIVDARGVLDGRQPTVIGNWITQTRAQIGSTSSCHHIRELRPGVLLTACRPFAVISINEEDGGSPEKPKVLSFGKSAKFVHSARWPNQGTDDLIMTGGEENFTARCEQNNSEFKTYSAKDVNAGTSNEFSAPLDEVVPKNGTYADGQAPAGALGCSVHWFQEHPSFKNGGLVALSEYENGVRFLQIKPDGEIVEQGHFVSLASSSSAPHWAGKDGILYSIDYQRGIDILRYKGDTYVPTAEGKVKQDKTKIKGTNGTRPAPRPNARQKASREKLALHLRKQGWRPGICSLAAKRGDRR